MPIIREGKFDFHFPDEGHFLKLDDDHGFCKKQLSGVTKMGFERQSENPIGLKSCDFLYVLNDEAWLIEVTDYRHHGRAVPPIADYPDEVTQKLCGSLTGLAAMSHAATTASVTETQIARLALRSRLFLVLHIEANQTVYNAAAYEKRFRAYTKRIGVTCYVSGASRNGPFPWSVSPAL